MSVEWFSMSGCLLSVFLPVEMPVDCFPVSRDACRVVSYEWMFVECFLVSGDVC